MRAYIFFVMLSLLASSITVSAKENMIADIEELKKSVVGLEQALNKIEQTSIYPDDTQMQVFVSSVSGKLAEIQSVKLRLNDRLLASHIYAEKERQALKHGGIHPLHKTNVSPGKHELNILIQGLDKQGRAWRDVKKHTFTKTRKAALLEFIIRDSAQKRRPDIGVREW